VIAEQEFRRTIVSLDIALLHQQGYELMSPNVARRISFLVGPLMGGFLIAWAAWVGAGPGLALICVLGAFVLIVLAPILQFLLIRTQAYRGNYVRACLTVISVSIGILVIAALSGLFNFW